MELRGRELMALMTSEVVLTQMRVARRLAACSAIQVV
jgi:hypothetical protein